MIQSRLSYHLKDGFSTPYKGESLRATRAHIRLELDPAERIRGAVLTVMFDAESMVKLKALMPPVATRLPPVATPCMELSLESDFSQVQPITDLSQLVDAGILELKHYSFLRAAEHWIDP